MMIQSTDNELLRSAGGQFSATQFIQDPLRAMGPNADSVPALARPDSSQVNLSDSSKLLSVLQGGESSSDALLGALGNLVQALTGKKVSDITLASEKLETSAFSFDTAREALRVNGRSGLDYRYHTLHAEGSQLSYSAQGSIELEDGTQLQFDFSLQVSNVYIEETRGRVRVNGAQLREALSSGLEGVQARAHDAGFIADMDQHGVRRLLDGLDHGRGRHHHHHEHERLQDERKGRNARARDAVELAA